MAGNVPIPSLAQELVSLLSDLHFSLIQPSICAVKTGIHVSGNGALKSGRQMSKADQIGCYLVLPSWWGELSPPCGWGRRCTAHHWMAPILVLQYQYHWCLGG